MLISRECDYSIRIVRALAREKRLTVGQICKLEHVPQPYAYKIIKKLENAGILKGYRGVHGGYELAAKLTNISLYDIYKAIEDKLILNECMQEGYSCPNNINGKCRVHRELLGLQDEMIVKMQSLSMAKILL